MRTKEYFVIFSLIFSLILVTSSANRTMVWMCLELCGSNSIEISLQLEQIQQNSDSLTAVAFEIYGLGENSTLTYNNVTIVSPQIVSFGLEAWAQLSSYPYPPQFLHWMKEVFNNPQPFINSCIEQAQKYQYTGFNLDWEPTTFATTRDAEEYANFITTFANALHEKELKLSVDFSSWSPLWNFTLLAETTADRLIDMSTYTSSDSSFLNQLENAVELIGIEKLGVGLETIDYYGGYMSEEDIQWRIEQIENYGCTEIDVWDAPLPPFWWSLLKDFKEIGDSSSA